jgi:hypothetical protein
VRKRRSVSPEPAVAVGPVDADTGARLAWCVIAVAGDPTRRSPPALRKRLNALSDRHGGAHAVSQRSREIPAAYDRLQARLGFDLRSPPEALTVDRLIRGAYRSRGVLRDALTIATADTEVAVWALDADRVTGSLRISDRAVADDTGPLAALFATPDSVTRATRRLLLYALVAPGIPDLAVEEALAITFEIIVAA